LGPTIGRTYDGKLVLAVEQHILTAAFHRVNELERQATTADDGDVCQVSEPVPVRLEVTFVYAWY